MTNEELDALCDTCPHKDKVNEYGDCSAPADFACPQIEVYVREKKEKKMSFMSELLSRCENSDDADKRELVVYVNKLDAIRDSLEKQLWMSKNETTRAQNTMAAMKVKLNELKARIKEEDADLHAADDEIDELHEKYRWRKQSEELPKNDDIVQIWGRKYFELSFGYYSHKEKTWYERRHEDDDVECGEYIRYWRPLDVPEEANKP